MAIVDFPPVDVADENGLLAIGGDMEVESLLLAYSRGIFPWPISEDYPLAWFSPDPRGILDFENLHIPRRLERSLKNSRFVFKLNENFERVIHNCAIAKRKGQPDTWITDEVINSYISFHKAGFAYSAETYLDDQLVGGVYGVCINGFVSGESMFFKEDNASKFALIKLCQYLEKQGVKWLDTQMVTPIVESLGGGEISREDFLKRLDQSLEANPIRF
ncbi:MAG: leucyl/phenylalanyl-tRNA--protein transferase [Oligoflexia bacterium]|nr:leucyl/phenylalanyl-tRNA--protein transferase [Oligoflexia bacterium]